MSIRTPAKQALFTHDQEPWNECDNMYAIMYRVGDGQHPNIPEILSEEGKDFLQNCFVSEQTDRWTATMLMGHPFVKVLLEEDIAAKLKS